MTLSDKYYNNLNRLRKKNLCTLEMIKKVQESFFSSLNFLPKELLWDLFNYYLDLFDKDPNPDKSFKDTAYHLSYIIDLFNGEYAVKEDQIPDEEFEFIRDTVSDNAIRIDEEILLSVMKIVVEKGLIK